jgi:sugar/nucleoside kinase (ribokinase family)
MTHPDCEESRLWRDDEAISKSLIHIGARLLRFARNDGHSSFSTACRIVVPSNTMPRFKVTVIGTINKDTIIFPNGKRAESFGGILYNLSALSGLGGKWMEIYPVCNLGYDVYNQVERILKKYDNVKLNGINKVRRKNNHAYLLMGKENQREEILRNRVPVLSFTRIKPFLDNDAILVNFISGFDISLNTLRRVRKNTDAMIFLDMHSLTLGIHKNGKRFFKTPKSWREYLKQADLVQTNLLELFVLSGKKLESSKDIRDFGNYVLSLGPKVLLVTMGEDGAVMIYRDGRVCKFKKCEGIKVRGFKDTTGCGDVFLAGFLAYYLYTGKLSQSLDFANRFAAEKCKISGVEGVAELLKKIALTNLL